MKRRNFCGTAMLAAASSIVPFMPIGHAFATHLQHKPRVDDLPSPIRTITIFNTSSLRSALAGSRPGDHLVLMDGTYQGSDLVISQAGSAQAPIVVRALNQLKAKLAFGVQLTGSHVVMAGLHVEGHGIILGGSNNRITRCKLNDNPGIAILCRDGADGTIDHCDLTVRWFPRGIDARGARRNAILISSRPGEKFYGCHVYRNWIHDMGPKPTSDYDSAATHALAIGETAVWGDIKLNSIIEDNLFEKCMAGYGVLEPKTPGNILRRNTMIDCPNGGMLNRQGQDNVWEENYIENSAGMTLWSRVIARRNTIIGGKLNVGTGNVEWNVLAKSGPAGGSPYSRAKGCRLENNKADLMIGKFNRTCPLQALDTVISGNEGRISYGSQSGSTMQKSSDDSGSVARKLSRTEVGPLSV